MNISQRLKHGKALCGKVFSGFVETFNALVDFKDNLKGDDDVSRGNGHIRVDRTNPRFPIIRCSGCRSGGDSGGAVDVDDVSVGKKSDAKIEVKGYHDLTNTETDKSLAQMIAPESGTGSGTSETLERDRETANGVSSPTAVKYRKVGYFHADTATTNLVFTKDATGGGVKISLFYK